MQIKSSIEKFTTTESKVYSIHIPIPREIALHFINGENRRIICTLTDKVTIRSGLMPHGEYWYILLNETTLKKTGFRIGQQIEFELKKDNSEYGMDMPEELEVMLDQEPEVMEHFKLLTPGKQRNLIYLVNKVKNSDSRINKSLAITEHLRESKGKVDFKRLNELIKQYNQLGKLK